MTETKGHAFPGSFSPDGKLLAYDEEGAGGRRIYIVPLDLSDPDHPKAGTPESFEQGGAEQTEPAFSPDGRWLAYTSVESGPRQVYVRPYPPSGGGKWQVSSVQGNFPRWSRTRPELYYVGVDNRIMAVDYTISGSALVPGRPRPWCDSPIQSTGTYSSYDIAPDGNRFVVFPLGRNHRLHGSRHLSAPLLRRAEAEAAMRQAARSVRPRALKRRSPASRPLQKPSARSVGWRTTGSE